MLTQQQIFSRIIQILTTGKNAEEEEKDVIFAPTFFVESLEKKEVREFIRALRVTNIKVISFPCCEGITKFPKKLSKLFGKECSISVIERKRRPYVLFISSALFTTRWVRNDKVTRNVEYVK